MSERSRLVLHAGSHKTGSSFIQRWLYANRTALHDQGVLYPEIHMRFPGVNHNAFAELLKKGKDFNQLSVELAARSTGSATVILSSETLFSLLHAGRDTAEAFNEAFAPYFDISVIVYLRRQDEYLESAFGEMVKHKSVNGIESILQRPMNWYVRLKHMESVFGKGRIVARPYCPTAWFGGRIELDFLVAAQLDPPSDTTDIEHINKSMHRRKRLFLQSLDKSPIVHLSKFIKQVQESNAIEDDGIRWLLSPDRRAELIEKYRASNERLCRHFVAEKWASYFLTPPEDRLTWFPARPITEKERLAFQTEIWARTMRAEAALHKLRSPQSDMA